MSYGEKAINRNMVNRPAKIIQMVDRQVRNRLSSVRGMCMQTYDEGWRHG